MLFLKIKKIHIMIISLVLLLSAAFWLLQTHFEDKALIEELKQIILDQKTQANIKKTLELTEKFNGLYVYHDQKRCALTIDFKGTRAEAVKLCPQGYKMNSKRKI